VLKAINVVFDVLTMKKIIMLKFTKNQSKKKLWLLKKVIEDLMSYDKKVIEFFDNVSDFPLKNMREKNT